MLKQNKFIELQEKKDRGEKFYKIKSKSKLEFYYNKLKQWWSAKLILKNNVRKEATKLEKAVKRNSKKAMYRSRILRDSDTKKQLLFVSKRRQLQITKTPYPKPVIIFDLPYSEGEKIIKSYLAGLLCETCFHENKISFLTDGSDEQICELGHAKILQNNTEFIPHTSYPVQKRSKSISDSELESQIQEYLRKSRKPKIENE
jgi:hypothetical protein